MWKDRSANLIITAGVCGSIFFIYLGYLTAAVIGYVQDKSSDILTGMYMILEKPFGRYINRFTPVTMILGFIIFEIIFFLTVLQHGGRSENEEEILSDSESEDITEKSFEKGEEKNAFVTSENLFNEIDLTNNNDLDVAENESTYVFPEVSEDIDSTRSDSISVLTENDKDTVETEISFSDEVVTELLNDYDLSQIKAMLALKAYISSVDVSLLKRMFKPTMSANEITDYIKIFYD